MFYFDVLKRFYQDRIKYLIVGGLAVNLHGVPRVTQDIDIIIATDKDNILRTNRILKELGYVPRLPVDPDDMADKGRLKEWIEEKNMKAFSFWNNKEAYKVVDIVLVHPLDFEISYRSKVVREAEGVEIFLASVEDIIKMKEASGREQDMSDIKMLRKVTRLMEQEDE
jgi:hypothetical protein